MDARIWDRDQHREDMEGAESGSNRRIGLAWVGWEGAYAPMVNKEDEEKKRDCVQIWKTNSIVLKDLWLFSLNQ